MSGKTVLIVEDNFDNRAIYAELLRLSGYRVLEARNGEEGVEQAREHGPDLVLMDLSMPVMDGWSAMAALREDEGTAGIPVLALSAHVVMEGDHRRAREAGFLAYLTKPIEPKEVLREVQDWIGPPTPVSAAVA